MPEVRKVPFMGSEIICVVDAGLPLFSLRSVAAAIGFDGESAMRSAKADELLGPELCEYTVQVEGQQGRKMVFLPIKRLAEWLGSIQANKLKDDNARKRLLAFRRGASEAFDQVFFSGTTPSLAVREAAAQARKVVLERMQIKDQLAALRKRDRDLAKQHQELTTRMLDQFVDDVQPQLPG